MALLLIDYTFRPQGSSKTTSSFFQNNLKKNQLNAVNHINYGILCTLNHINYLRH